MAHLKSQADLAREHLQASMELLPLPVDLLLADQSLQTLLQANIAFLVFQADLEVPTTFPGSKLLRLVLPLCQLNTIPLVPQAVLVVLVHCRLNTVPQTQLALLEVSAHGTAPLVSLVNLVAPVRCHPAVSMVRGL
jgi:hypothetical protein